MTREVITIDAPIERVEQAERTRETAGESRAADARQPTKWIHVTAAEPCPCCGRTSNCAISEDGRRAYCRYEPSPFQGRDGGYTHHLDKRPDFVPREITARPEASNNIASVEHRNEVYREMLKHLYLNDTDYTALRERGLTDERITAKGYVSTPNRAEANHIAETLDKQGVDLRGVPGFWRARHLQPTVS